MHKKVWSWIPLQKRLFGLVCDCAKVAGLHMMVCEEKRREGKRKEVHLGCSASDKYALILSTSLLSICRYIEERWSDICCHNCHFNNRQHLGSSPRTIMTSSAEAQTILQYLCVSYNNLQICTIKCDILLHHMPGKWVLHFQIIALYYCFLLIQCNIKAQALDCLWILTGHPAYHNSLDALRGCSSFPTVFQMEATTYDGTEGMPKLNSKVSPKDIHN